MVWLSPILAQCQSSQAVDKSKAATSSTTAPCRRTPKARAQSLLFRLFEPRNRAFLDLGYNIDMRVHHFSYVVVNGESQNHRYFRWVELVVVFQPAGHHGCGALQGFGQRVGYPDRHKVFVVLGA